MKEKEPVPIRPDQPELFGTGTTGPAPKPAAVLAGAQRDRRGRIPMNVAFQEIVNFVTRILKESGEQWDAGARQDFVSTVFIAAQREHLLGPWEREP